MISVPIVMPQLGESIAEATVISFFVKPGDEVRADQDLMEVETSKATTCVTAPCPGRIQKITAEKDEAYPVGAQLGFIEISAAVARELGIDLTPTPEQEFAIPEAASAK